MTGRDDNGNRTFAVGRHAADELRALPCSTREGPRKALAARETRGAIDDIPRPLSRECCS